MKRFLKNPGNRYLLLWALFNLKGFLYPDGSIINQTILLIIMLLSLVEFVKNFQSKIYRQSIFFKGLNAVMIMYTVYGLVLFVTDGTTVKSLYGDMYSSISFIQGAWIVLMPIYVIYIYTRQGYLKLETLQKWMALFLLVGIAQYFTLQKQIFQALLERGAGRDEFTNGAGYILLSLIPGMLVFKRKLLTYIGIAVCVVFVIMAMKRGAIIIAALALFLIIRHDLKVSKGSYKIAVFALVVISIAFLVQFVEHMLDTSDYFNERIAATLEGDSSDRDIIYQHFWNTYLHDSNLFQYLLGRGAMSTLKYGNIYAHNDWLEILFCQGVVGIFIFIYYWKCFYYNSKSTILSERSRFCLFILFIMFGVKCFFSMSIVGMPIYATVMLGFSLADGFDEQNSAYKD